MDTADLLDRLSSILVVDDDPTMGDMVVKMLSRLGFENVDLANTMVQAESLIRNETYQLVISDLYLKPGGGLELLSAIRSHAQNSETSFLLMTGSVGGSVAATLCGANGYILKPFTHEQLKAKLERIGRPQIRVA